MSTFLHSTSLATNLILKNF